MKKSEIQAARLLAPVILDAARKAVAVASNHVNATDGTLSERGEEIAMNAAEGAITKYLKKPGDNPSSVWLEVRVIMQENA